MVRRFAVVTLATLVLLTVAVSLMPMLPPEVQPVATVGPVIWSVFFASIILLVPFISRSQNVMREFAMLAGISTVATSVDLLFVAVFSFSQFTSLTLSLFLALGASLEHLAQVSGNEDVKTLAETLDEANGEILEHNRSPARKVGELDNRGSHFYLALYWAKALARRDNSSSLAQRFKPLAEALAKNEAKINSELIGAQGKKMDIGGYYQPDPAKTAKAINYRHRGGATKIDFKGTANMPAAKGEAKVTRGGRLLNTVSENEFFGEQVKNQLIYYPTVTREAFRNQGRLTDLIESGKLFSDIGMPALNPENDRVMLCGSPAMLRDLKRACEERGLAEGNTTTPGDFVIERAFADQ